MVERKNGASSHGMIGQQTSVANFINMSSTQLPDLLNKQTKSTLEWVIFFNSKFNIGEVWVRPWMWQCVPSVFKALQLMGCPQCNGNMIGSCTLISNKNMSTREDNCKLPMINPECWEPTITCGLRVDMDLPSKNIKCWNANNQLSCSQ